MEQPRRDLPLWEERSGVKVGESGSRSRPPGSNGRYVLLLH